MISDQKKKLMQKSEKIRQSLVEAKSHIEGDREKKKQREDDQEIAREVSKIKERGFYSRNTQGVSKMNTEQKQVLRTTFEG